MVLTIITINYNGAGKTIRLMDSLKIQTDQDFKVIVVDNASEIGDFQKLPQPTSQIEIIRNSINLGFSGGCNIGIKKAIENGPLRRGSGQADWVLLLNNDTWVENDFIASLKPILSPSTGSGQARQGIIGLPLDEGGRMAYGGKIRWLKPVGFHIHDWNKAKSEKNIHAVGGAMLIHKSVFEKIGFFDEKYFLYFEDVDFNVRARKNNISIEMLEKPIVHHGEPSSTTKNLGSALLLQYHYRNALYFNLKNGPWYIKLAVWPWSWIIMAKQIVKIMLRINKEHSLAILNGVMDFYSTRMGIIKN